MATKQVTSPEPSKRDFQVNLGSPEAYYPRKFQSQSLGQSDTFYRYKSDLTTANEYTGNVPLGRTSKEVKLDIHTDTVRQRSSQVVTEGTYLSSTIKPFQKKSYTMFRNITKEIRSVLTEKQGWRIIGLMLLNFICALVLIFYCQSTNSMALTAFSFLTIFDLFSLLTCFLSIWVSLQKPTTTFQFGYGRFEVVAVFASTILVMFGALFVFKESVERIFMPPEVFTESLLFITGVGLVVHLVVTYGVVNKPFIQVSAAATSNWLQDAMTDLGHNICGICPVLGRIFLGRLNPFALVALAGAASILVTTIAIDYHHSYLTDTVAAMIIASLTWATMLPLSIYSGQILLQTCPAHILDQVDKCLREASTLDGVLEFRNEHFWTVSFGKLAGSLHVRVRRDANEQMVLAHVTNKLSPHVTYLTIQVFKEDWTRPSSTTKLSAMAMSVPEPSPSRSNRPPSLPQAYSPGPVMPSPHTGMPQYNTPSQRSPNIVDTFRFSSRSNVPRSSPSIPYTIPKTNADVSTTFKFGSSVR